MGAPSSCLDISTDFDTLTVVDMKEGTMPRLFRRLGLRF